MPLHGRDVSQDLPTVAWAWRARCCLLLLLLSVPFASQAQPMQLEPQAGLPVVRVDITPQEANWLQARRIVRLGIGEQDYGPLSLVRQHKLKGLMADYLSMITGSLGIGVEVHAYPDWPSALQALRAGEVDVLGLGSSYEAQLPGLLLSSPYAANQAVLVGRDGNFGPQPTLSKSKLATVEGYTAIDKLRSRFPDAHMRTYPSVREALHAVEFKHDDWAICDAITASYQMGLGELPNLRMRPLTGLHEPGYSFVFRANDALLATLFDRVLANIPLLTQADILSYWGGNARFDSRQGPLYSAEQQQWLTTQPEVRVVVSGAVPPYSFFDDDGNFSGMVADLLHEIGRRSGLRFKVIERSNATEIVRMLQTGKAQMSPITLATPEHQDFIDYTEPFGTSSYALVGPRENAAHCLDDAQIRRVSLIKGSPLINELQLQHPQWELVETDNPLDSLVAVADGDADAAVLLLPVARYLINQYFAKNLRVITSLPQQQASLSFAIAKDQPLLLGVMQATFDQIEPRMVGNLLERWQSSRPAEGNVWINYAQRLRWVMLVTGTTLGLLLLWLAYAWYRGIRDRSEQERQAFRSALLDGLPQPVVVRDLGGAFVLCNNAFYAVHGLQPSAVIGRQWHEVEGLDSAPACVQPCAYEALLLNNEPAMSQIDLLVGGELRSYRQWSVAHHDLNGRCVGLLMGWIDMSETERLLRELHAMRDQAVLASEAKSRFLAVMSHEIRTPLNAIIGLLELTLARVDQGENWDRSAIEVAHTSSNALMLLIGDILDLSKIESGKLLLEPQRNSPQEILESVERVFQGLARQKGLYLTSDLQLESSHEVLVDGPRLKQVLSNLLSNAIKFTDQGGVSVSLRTRQSAAGLQLRFIVEDSGIGIAPEHQHLLFQPFSQVQEPNNTRGGTGLGLAICQQLVEMMAGQLQLESRPGQGTRITLTLTAPPLEPMSRLDSPLLTSRPKIPLRVLLVDDHPANRLLLSQQLAFLGHAVSEAENGQHAFVLLQAKTFDVLITDCNMPLMDGYELTRSVRLHERATARPRLLIVGFTANAQELERQRCLAEGMDDCLFKPVSLTTLRTCLEAVLPDQRRGEATEIEPVSLASPETAVLDLNMFNSLTDGDPLLERALLDSLYTSNCQDLLHFDEYVAGKRWYELAQVVHRVRGAARMVGAQTLIDASKGYEEGLRQELTDQETGDLALRVRCAISQLQEAVAKKMIS